MSLKEFFVSVIHFPRTRSLVPVLAAAALLSLSACGRKESAEPATRPEAVSSPAVGETGPPAVTGQDAPAPPGDAVPPAAAPAPIPSSSPSPAGAALSPAESSTSPALTPAPSPEASAEPALLPHAPAEARQTSAPVAASPALPSEPPVPLNQSSSPYLRQAARLPVKWSSWSAEALQRARSLNRPVLICIGANWSHACQVMDQTTWSDPEIARLVNEEFVAIRVDRDERPDLDARYQAAHAAINRRAGGYPLTVFALPDGRPFESLGFVGLESSGGQVGMKDVLRQISSIYSERLADAERMADAVERTLAQAAAQPGRTAELDEDLVHRLHGTVSRQYDAKTETFGPSGQPKFPAAPAILALLHYYSDYGDSAALSAAGNALSRLYLSGLRDSVMGGYFRYAEDDALQKPQFEKLLNVQAEMLSANALAHAATGKYLFKEAAQDVLVFIRDTFEAPETGGFYSSQEADLGPGDNGSYFTWTEDEVHEIVGNRTAANVFIRYFNIDKGRGGRSVAYPTAKMQSVADTLKISRTEGIRHLDDVQQKLHDARMAQDAPYVNKTMIASWNSAMIGAYLDVYKYLGDTEARDFALKSANFLMRNMLSPEKGVARTLYKNQASGYGFLEDQVRFAEALLQCFEVSGQHEYLETATRLMEMVEARYLDPATGLYVDRIDAEPVGLMEVALRPVADTVSPSPNAVAAMNWYQLYQLTMKSEYRDRAERLVAAAAAQPGVEGLAACTLSRAAALVINGAPKVLVVGPVDDAGTRRMHETALPVFRMGKVVEVMSPEEAARTDYKPARDGRPITYVCTAATCAPPVREAEKLPDLIRRFARPEGPAGSGAPPEADAGAGRLRSRAVADAD